LRFWIDKVKEVLSSVLPIVLLVLLLNWTLVPLGSYKLAQFLIGAVFIVLGLSLFLVGVSHGITPFGSRLGEKITRSNKIWIVIGAGILLGLFITIAEPDLQILAGEVDLVTNGLVGKWALVLVVSVGIALMLTAGLIRLVYNFPLHILLTIIYGTIFVLSLFVTPEFLAISFDASGATTGAMTVPFMLALALGIAAMKRDGKASEKDSFGLVAIASAGAVMAVLIMSILSKGDTLTSALQATTQKSHSVFTAFLLQLKKQSVEIAVSMLPLAVILAAGQPAFLKFKKRMLKKVIKGFILTWVGLVLFLAGVNAGFMDVGREIGSRLAGRDNKAFLILIGFLLGFVTILAEPAVHVLTDQITEVTSGSVPRKAVLTAMSLGVGSAVAISIIRILIPGLQLWHILLPGYILALVMAHIGPKLFVGMAFDSGGVASGPMTAAFILAFAQGAADKVESADVLVDGFGVIALVALAPIIFIQALGLIYRKKSSKGGIAKDGKRS